jgi:hypothetical protein
MWKRHGMTSYTVKLFALDARIEAYDVLAEDVLSAAGAAVPYFSQRGEHVGRASAIVVERSDSSFAVFRPCDVLEWVHEHHAFLQPIRTDHVTRA